MNRVSIILLFSLVISGYLLGQGEPELWAFPVDQGKITYKYTGDTEGQRILYFRDFGNEQAVYTELVRSSTFFAVKTSTPEKVVEILTGGVHYHFDLEAKTAYTLDFPVNLVYKYFRIPKDKTIEQGLNSIGAIFDSMEDWNGYSCQKWIYRGREFWLWKGLLLKMNSTGLNKNFSMEAVDVDFENRVDDKKFSFPKHLKLSE